MKTVFKRLISSLLLVVMLVAAIPASLVSAAAADIDWEALKDKYGLTDDQIDAAKDVADQLGLTQEQIDAVEDYYESLPPEEQEALKETVKESIENGETPDLGEVGGEVVKDVAKAMLIATIKQAAGKILDRIFAELEGVTVQNPFEIQRVYEGGQLAGVNFVVGAPEEANLLDLVKSIVSGDTLYEALTMVAGAVLMYDKVEVNGYTVYDLTDPATVRNALVQIYKANPVKFSTIANMEGNTVVSYNFSLSAMGIEIDLPVNFVIDCSEATLNKIKATAKKLDDMVEINGDFSAEDGVLSADLEGILDVSDYVDNLLGLFLPAAIANDYALVREKIHAMTLGDLVDQLNLKNVKLLAEKLGYEAQFTSLVEKIADRFNLDIDKIDTLDEVIDLMDSKDLLPVYIKSRLQKAYGVLGVEAKLNTTIGAYYNGDGSYSCVLGEKIGPKSVDAYLDAALNKLLDSKAVARLDKALKIFGYSSVEHYVNKIKEKFDYIYSGKYDLDLNLTLVLFDVYTVTFVDEKGNVIDTQKVVAGDAAEDPYYHGGSMLNTNYTADQVYENVQSNLTVALTPINHKEVVEVIVAGDCEIDRQEHVTCGYAGCDFTEDRLITAPGHNYVSERIEANCYEDGCTRYTCTVCGHQYDDDFEAAHHTWSGWNVTAEASCTANGKQVRRCLECGLNESEIIPAFGHTLAEHVVPATCTSGGYTLWYCSVCFEAGIYSTSDKLDHDFVEIGRDEFCTKEGTVYYECSYGCGTKKQETIPAVGHNHVGVVTPPTCTEDGYTVYTCDRCGDTYVDDIVPALNHDYVVISETPATHLEAGEIVYECARCGHTYTEIILPEGHDWDSVWYEPTCTGAGYYIHTCTGCGISYMETVGEPLYHDYIYTIVDPSCEEPGKFVFVCDLCGHTFTETFGTPIGHNYNSVVSKQPTCQEEGETLFTCANCGDTYTEAIAIVDHEMVVYSNPDPKCEEDVVIVLVCKYGCGETVEIVVPATGHNWVDYERVEATCGEDGYDTDCCSNCGEYRTFILPATGAHEYEIFVVHDATCAHAGMITHFCMVCGDHYEEYTDINPGAHSFKTTVKTSPDCVNGGVLVHTCLFCGIVVEEQTPALGHAWDFTNGVYVAPSCGVDGSWTFSCARGCEDTLVIVVPALGVHAWGNAVVLKPATCVDDGEVQYTCSVCGETTVETIKATGEHTWKDVHAEGINCCNPSVDKKVCSVCGEETGYTETPIYRPTILPDAVNMAFMNNMLLVKIDRMTVGEFKANFYGSITVYDKQGNELDDSKYIGTGVTFVCDACETLFHVAVIADINGDGKVNSIDYMYVKRYVLGTYKLEGVMLAAADVNVDGSVTSLDYVMTKRHVMYRYHIYEKFPAWENIDSLITSMPNPFAN